MQLLELFKELSVHPKNAEELKGLILQLAVQGKLTAKWRDEHPDVEPASELLKKIKKEKAQLVKEKKIKKEKPLPPITEEEMPYALPEGWVWCRMQDIGQINPRNKADENIEVGFIPMKDISETYSIEPQFETRLWKDVKSGFTHFQDNDVAFAKITPCFQNSKACVFQGLPNGKGAGTTELHVFRRYSVNIFPHFIYCIFKSPDFLNNGETKMTGSAGQKRVPKTYFSEYLMGLPPAKEQKAIVSIVNELMEEIEQLEDLTKVRIQLKEDYATSVLHHLIHTDDAATAWNELKPHFSTFFTEKSTVKKLRASILQLAVQGKLTAKWRESNPDIEPASELLKHIQAEKQQLIAEKKIKKEKPLPPITEEEMPYGLPEGWVWCRLGTLVRFMAYGTSQKTNNNQNDVPVLRMGNISSDGKLNFDKLKFISPSHKDLPRLFLENEDIVFNRTNSYELVGKSAVYKGNNNEYTLASYLIKVSLFNNLLVVDYINNYIISDMCRKSQIEPQITAQTNQANFSGTKLKNIILPLPPLQEQKGIVEKVNALMALCDKLEHQIEIGQSQVEELMMSCVKEVVG